MTNDSIVTALDMDGTLTRIENAVSGLRYWGATQDHETCELHPRFPQNRRPSFAHMPKREHPCGRGQSKAHREAIQKWTRLLRSQISGCLECVIRGIELDEHYCFAWIDWSSGKAVAQDNPKPFFGKVVWICDICLRPHVWDLLNGADSVISDQKVPSLDSRVRPDITILDKRGDPLSFIEFDKSHLSDSAVALARDLSIPLFVVDVGTTALDTFQGPLYNPRRGMWKAIAESMPEMSEELAAQYRQADEFNYRMSEGMAKDGGSSSAFCAIPDEQGNYVDAVFHATGKSPALPDPAIGQYLVSSRVDNLPCERQLEAQSDWSSVFAFQNHRKME